MTQLECSWSHIQKSIQDDPQWSWADGALLKQAQASLSKLAGFKSTPGVWQLWVIQDDDFVKEAKKSFGPEEQ
eukprot:13525528-Alexandrium_andersonii.AAC.1